MIHLELSPFDAASVLIVLSAVLGWVNHRCIKLPGTVAMTLMGAVASVVVIVIDLILPSSRVSDAVTGFLNDIDFHETLDERHAVVPALRRRLAR
ncbi:hypothetical protein [Brevundimonas vesicularis]|uniref:hypothetical protein n=1 Tax=Brevundimonas vesicularis TaxID=41276 RepID=UPI0022ABE95D|nr:hypothetical protein [Brevundimonas vesicularis]